MKDRLSNLLEKIKNNKKLQIFLLGFVVLVILLVYITYFVQGTNEVKTEIVESFNNSTEEYIIALEEKLENVLSDIEGAGRVNVAITVSSGFVNQYAYEETSKDTLSSSNTSTNLILVNDEPIIISQSYPTIAGVLVVAEGGEKLKVKLDILSSIQTLLDVANENITILSGEF